MSIPWTADPAPAPADVLDFWRAAGERGRWFTKDTGFDDDFRARFLGAHLAAARRALDGWARTPEGALALLILLDQFPRNAFRGSAHMYATDPLARHFARGAVEAGFLERVEPALRLFMCLPFAHSEDAADQALSVELHARLGPDSMKHALGHRDIVLRFGRFPHRNAMLGRATTEEEAAFLAAGGFAG